MFAAQLALWARRARQLPIAQPLRLLALSPPRLSCVASVQLPVDAPASGALRDVATAVLPALAAAWTLFPPVLADLMPSILMTGKRRTSGKSKRHPKPANHGARACNHVGRRQRAAAIGNLKYATKK